MGEIGRLVNFGSDTLESIDQFEDFELRVPEIDGDHWVILNLIKAVQTAAAAGDRGRSESYLDRLVAFSAGHFAREELFLELWKYPDVKEHATEHAQLQERAEVVKEACSDIESREAFEKCCKALVSFLADDVRRGDIKLKSFFESAGLTLQPA